jgi:hypothetical protein
MLTDGKSLRGVKMAKQLDYDTLREALYNLIEIKGINAFRITKESNVYNIKEIASGQIQPTLQSWLRLSDAFPGDIPEPCYAGDHSQIVGNQNRHTIIVGHGSTMSQSLSAEEQLIIKLLREKDKDGTIARRIISELLRD